MVSLCDGNAHRPVSLRYNVRSWVGSVWCALVCCCQLFCYGLRRVKMIDRWHSIEFSYSSELVTVLHFYCIDLNRFEIYIFYDMWKTQFIVRSIAVDIFTNTRTYLCTMNSVHDTREAICDTKKAVASHNLVQLNSVRCLSLWVYAIGVYVVVYAMRLIVTNRHNELFTFQIHLHAFTLLMPTAETFPFVRPNTVVAI